MTPKQLFKLTLILLLAFAIIAAWLRMLGGPQTPPNQEQALNDTIIITLKMDSL